MEVKFKRKILKYGLGLYVSIPKPVAEAFEIKKGDSVFVIIRDNELVVKKELTA